MKTVEERIAFRSERQPDGTYSVYTGIANTFADNLVRSAVPPSSAARVVQRMYREYHKALYGSKNIDTEIKRYKADVIERLVLLALPFFTSVDGIDLGDVDKTPANSRAYIPAPGAWACDDYMSEALSAAHKFIGITRTDFFFMGPHGIVETPIANVPIEDLLILLSIFESFDFVKGAFVSL